MNLSGFCVLIPRTEAVFILMMDQTLSALEVIAIESVTGVRQQ